MKNVNTELFLNHIDELQSKIENNYEIAKADAIKVATENGWDSEKLLDFILLNDSKYDVAKFQFELDILSQYIIDVEPVEADQPTIPQE
mgnify:CR=1 FL=1